MRFQELLTHAEVRPAYCRGDVEIFRLTADSRRCGGGACFVAVCGSETDGHKYIPAALAGGASAVICQNAAGIPERVPVAVLSDTRAALPLLAQAFHGWPFRKLTCVGVTGTKGKSTTTYLIRAILQAAAHKVALIGTIGYEIGSTTFDSSNTTPGPVDLAEMGGLMVREQCSHLVMEVSSHALHQGRVAGIPYSVAAFTNLSGEHLDYHRTMDEYLAAKRILFEGLASSAAAVVNADDPAGLAMASATQARVLTYGLEGKRDLLARVERMDEKGTHFVIVYAEGQTDIRTPLIGRHNVHNCLAAAGVCRSLGIDWSTIAAAFSGRVFVPGRLQRVEVAAPFEVFVDYAHTDDSLEKTLIALRPLTRGRLIVLFGCGGNRDRTKRPRMARVAERLGDRVFVTSDNPRHEDPHQIIDEILAGMGPEGLLKTHVQIDRRKAIEAAIGDARDGDVVLLAGKGHEAYQIVGDTKHPFDDVEVAAAAMGQREVAR